MTRQRFSITESERANVWHVLDLDNLDTASVGLPRQEFASRFADALNACTPLDPSQVEAVRMIASDRMSAYAAAIIDRLNSEGHYQLADAVLELLNVQSYSYTYQLNLIAQEAAE